MKRSSVRPSVRPSVCPINRQQQCAAGLLLSAPRAGDIDRYRRYGDTLTSYTGPLARQRSGLKCKPNT